MARCYSEDCSDGTAWTGLNWLRIGTFGGQLRTRLRNTGFYTMPGNSCPTEVQFVLQCLCLCQSLLRFGPGTVTAKESSLLRDPIKQLLKGTAVPLQAWSGPEGPRKLIFPDFMTTAQDGGKVVSPAHRPPLLPGNTHGTQFC